MGDIIMGTEAIDRADLATPGSTRISLYNPSLEDGVLRTVSVWAHSDLTGLYAGIFWEVTASTFKCRDAVLIGAVAAGAKRTFAVALEVIKGDLLGYYNLTGELDRDIVGIGSYYATGNFCIKDTTKLMAYAAPRTYSIEGLGVTMGGIEVMALCMGSIHG